MEYALFGLGAFLLAAGMAGCVVPVVPGPLLAYCALLTRFSAVGSTSLAIGAIIVVVVTVVDYVLPAVFARRFDCTRWGVLGCSIGTIVGLFCMPFGIILGPFIGAVLGEIVAGRKLGAAMKGGFGALVGFALSSGVKLATVALFSWWFFTLPK